MNQEAVVTRTPEVRSLLADLAEPFDPQEVKWKPQVIQGNRAMAIAFVDARVVQDRLDGVLGAENWQDDYTVLADGSVTCKLQVRIGGEWVTKVDVGGPSEQPDGGDRMKAAFSDALKRAAIKLGVGRYLYRLPHQWVDYDPQKRTFVRVPTLPPFAIPKSKQQREGERNPPITAQQLDEINGRLTKLGKDYAWLANNIQTRFKTTEVKDLRYAQAVQLLAGLDTMIAQKK